MSLDLKTILHTADLARLDLTHGLADGEKEAALAELATQLGRIVGYFDILGEVDTSAVEPLYSVMTEPPAPRADQPEIFEAVEELMGQAPEQTDHMFVVPKIL